MRLIDADDLLEKVQENAPGFMDNGSTITKAFIMAMINTKSVAPKIDAVIDVVPVVRCKDCKKCDLPEEEPYENGYCSRCGYVEMDWFCADGERQEGR